MKQIGNYNKFPEGFPMPEPLKKGQIATFKLIHELSRKDPTDPTKILWPYSIEIPPTDTIFWTDAKEKLHIIDIGMILDVDKEGRPTRADTFHVQAKAFEGEFSLLGGNLRDQQLYQYFRLCNYNTNNKNRDTSKQGLFRQVNAVEEAGVRNKHYNLRAEAMSFVKDLSKEDLKKHASALNWNENDDTDIIRDKLYAFAEKNPGEFIKRAKNKDIDYKANLKRAADAKIIVYDTHQRKVSWAESQEAIAMFERAEGMDWLSQFSEWVRTHKDGKKTYEAITKQLEEAVVV